MQTHQLRYFVAVAEQRHFTHAARDLGVAQPSVSKQIRKLEEELGAPLFHRMKGNVALTPAGEALLPWARRVLGDLDAATVEVRELTELRRGRLALGATPSVSTSLLPRALARFHASYPGVELVVREAGSRDLVAALEEGALDLALVILPLVMFREGYDLRAATFAACRRAGFEPTLAVDGAEMDGVLRMAAAGIGVAIVPSIVIEPGGPLRAARLAQPLSRTIGFARRRDRRLARAASEFQATIWELLGTREWTRRVTRA
ncbi:MAG: LysR family transcriptional regulator [Chloroflexi bacterium]|nr:MAG: LysR family transcriptional regulator [Chloroflexota bacterium]